MRPSGRPPPMPPPPAHATMRLLSCWTSAGPPRHVSFHVFFLVKATPSHETAVFSRRSGSVPVHASVR